MARRSPRNIYRLPAVRRPVQNAAPVRVLQVNHAGLNQLEWNFEGAVAILSDASNLRVVNVTGGTTPLDLFGNSADSRAPVAAVLQSGNIPAGRCRVLCTYADDPDSTVDAWLFEAFDANETIFDGPQDRTPTIGRIDEP